MKRFLLSIGACFLILGTTFGQSVGDIAFLRVSATSDDDISFVALSNIPSGTEIYFTDEGWDDTEGTTGWRVSSEGHGLYTSSGLFAGDIVHIEETSSNVFTVTGGGTFSMARNSWTLGTSGDQLIAYTSSSGVRPNSPNFIAGIHYDDGVGTTTGSNNATTNWTSDGEISSSTQRSTLPNSLTNGTNAIGVVPFEGTEEDNYKYNCSVTSGTKTELLAAINNISNWDSGSSSYDNSDVCSSITVYPSVEISGDAGWRLLSFPVTGGTVADISDDTPVQGITGGDDAEATDSNFRIYDSSGEWEEPTNVSTAWGNGLGFALYFYDNTTNGSSELPVTLDASGSEPTGDVVVTANILTTALNDNDLTRYFTLSGNPYASNYNTNNITATLGLISDNIHLWNDATSSYTAADRTTDYVVSPWQGFWVETTAAGATEITIAEAGKTTTSTSGTFFSKTANIRGDISFTLSSKNTYDEAIRLSFRDYGSFGIDRADATKLVPMASKYATMAFKSGEMLKSVESLPYKLEEEVTLAFEEQLVGVSGEFTLNWKGLESIPSDWALTFHDYKTGETVDMRTATEYTFDAAAPATEKVNPINILTGPVAMAQKSKSAGARFGITITPTTSVNTEPNGEPTRFALEQNYPNPFNPSTTINYSIENSGQVQIAVYNLMGQKVAELVNETKSAGSYNVTWNASGAASGMYYYRLEANGQAMTRKMTLIK